MQLRSFKSVWIVLALSICVFACHKGDDDNSNASSAGKGGTSIIKATNMHHTNDTSIVQGKVLIKYNAVDKPGNDVYDDSATAIWTNGKFVAEFDSLKTGNYYLYGKGYDTSIAQNVKGGTGVMLTHNNTDTSLFVPVTED